MERQMSMDLGLFKPGYLQAQSGKKKWKGIRSPFGRNGQQLGVNRQLVRMGKNLSSSRCTQFSRGLAYISTYRYIHLVEAPRAAGYWGQSIQTDTWTTQQMRIFEAGWDKPDG